MESLMMTSALPNPMPCPQPAARFGDGHVVAAAKQSLSNCMDTLRGFV